MLVIPPEFSPSDPLWIKVLIAALCLGLLYFSYVEHSRNGTFSRLRLVRGTERGSSGGAMLLKLVGGLMVLAVGYPLLNEETISPCHALEKRAITEISKTSGKQDLGAAIMLGIAGDISNGSIAATAVKSVYPDIPPFAGCLVTYYRMALDPAYAKDLARAFGSK